VSCTEHEARLSAYLDGELAAPETRALEEHLGGCARCAAALDRLRDDDAALDRLYAPAREAADRLEARVLAAVRRERRGRPPLQLVRPLVWAAAGFLVALAIFRPWERPAVSPTPPQPLARVEFATGPLEILEGGAWRALGPGDPIPFGCAVRTNEAKAELDVAGENQVRLDAGTQVAVQSINRIELTQGQIWASSLNPLEIHAGDSKVACVEGARLNAQRNEDVAEYVLEAGNATVMDRAGNNIALQPSQSVQVSRGQAQRPVPAQDPALLYGWTIDLVALKGSDDPEFRRRIHDLLALIGETKLDYVPEDQIRQQGTRASKPLRAYLEDTARLKGAELKRRRAAEILSDIATRDQAGDLETLLDDLDPQVRFAAAAGLRRIMGRSGLPYPPEFWRDASIEERASKKIGK
jgi:hypothetical protein